MKNLLTSMLFLASISLSAQGNNNPKTYKQDKGGGGCRITFQDTTLKATLQNNTSQNNIQVTWNNNYTVYGQFCFYQPISQILERQKGLNSYDTLSLGYADTSYIDSSISISIAYNYRLTRKIYLHGINFTVYSDTITPQTVGINKESIGISKIYPIPASNSLFVETNQLALDEPYSIINITGREVLTGTISSNKMQVNIEALPTGFYFIRINESIKKFVVH